MYCENCAGKKTHFSQVLAHQDLEWGSTFVELGMVTHLSVIYLESKQSENIMMLWWTMNNQYKGRHQKKKTADLVKLSLF